MTDRVDSEKNAEVLRGFLLALPASGADGFEGLLQAALSAVAGLSFRLARSGDQRGRDGESAGREAILFEAKRYDGHLASAELLKKVAQLGADERAEIDLWIAAATVDVGAVTASDVERLSTRLGFATLILDWPANGSKPLADVLAGARDDVVSFLRRVQSQNADAVDDILAAIAAQQGFEARLTALRGELTSAALGLAAARAANRVWLGEVIRDERQAQICFGQMLAPLSRDHPKAPRSALLHDLSQVIDQAPEQERIIGVLGDEGAGKSWATLDALWALPDVPVIVVARPRDFGVAGELTDHTAFLARIFLRQTGGAAEQDLRPWLRRLGAWRANPTRALRFILMVDGVGERIDLKWAELLDGLSKSVSRLGGRLVFTCRPNVFKERLRTKLGGLCETVMVSGFSDDEVAYVLAAGGVDASKVSAQVKATLRTPRLLAIALAVFKAERLESFEALSVEHILYAYTEHLFAAGLTRQSGTEFRQTIVLHARELISKLEAGDRGSFEVRSLSSRLGVDPALASATLVEDLTQIVSGRFFSPDPSAARYAFERETLPIALGLALADHLSAADDVRLALDQFLPPIAPLDQTSAILFAALTTAAIEQRSEDVVGELLVALVGQQNIPPDLTPPMLSIACDHASAVFFAAEALAHRTENHSEFFAYALPRIATFSRNEDLIEQTMSRWLRTASFAPARALYLRGESHESAAKQIAEQAKRVSERLNGLTPAERDYKERRLLVYDDVDAPRLHSFVLFMGVKRSLASLAEDFYGWALASRINPSILSNDHQMRDLLRFNPFDWRATEEAVRAVVDEKIALGASEAGKWAAYWLLTATGEPDGAQHAEDTVASLRHHFEPRPSSLEMQCDSDPCDPSSGEPSNIEGLAERYAQVDVTLFAMGRDPTSDRYLIDDGRAAMARFRPGQAIALHKRYAEHVLQRPEEVLYLGASDVFYRYAPLIDRAIALAFLRRLTGPSTEAGEAANLTEKKTGLNYGFMAAFGALTEGERVEGAIALSQQAPILLSLGEMLNGLQAPALMEAIEAADTEGDQEALGRLFFLASETEALDEARIAPVGARVLLSQHVIARQSVMAYAATHRVAPLLRVLAASAWRAGDLAGREAGVERWYGSRALIEACQLGFITPDQALDRIDPSQACLLAHRVPAAHTGAAALLSAVIEKVTAAQIEAPLLDVELDVADGGSLPRFHVQDRASDADGDPIQLMAKMKETDEVFAARQRARHERFGAFIEALDDAGIRAAIEDIDEEGLAVLIEKDPDRLSQWTTAVEQASEDDLGALHNLGMSIARELARFDGPRAAELFRKLAQSRPWVRLVTRHAQLDHDVTTAWDAAHAEAVTAFCFERIDRAQYDRELAAEVLAAQHAGRAELLRAYVRSRLERAEPRWIARALTVCAFADDIAALRAILEDWSQKGGYLGDVARAGARAYDRNLWAKHWALKCAAATSAEELWRYSALLTRVVDFRFELWWPEAPAGSAFATYEAGLVGEATRRARKRADKRKSELFCGPTPAIYLGPD